MGKIKTITSKEFGTVRTITIDGTLYFSSKDVQEILGFGDTVSAVYLFVPAKDTRTILRSECGDTAIPKRGMSFVTADGAAALSRKSKEPFVKDFKRWIYSVQEEYSMKKLTTFVHPVFGTVRAVRIKDKPYFSLADIKKALGFGKSSTISMFVSSCNERKIFREEYGDDSIPKTGMKMIDEYGVASLAKFSKCANTESFMQWLMKDCNPFITEEVTAPPEENITTSSSDTGEIKIFENPSFGKVRTMEINGEPYFVGKDVAEILGYTAPRNAISTHIDDEDKTTALIQCDDSNYKSNAVVINESGLYSLILSSKLPKAKEFKRWVTSEVLPSIRKHGMYATEELISNPDLAIAAFTALKKEMETRKALQKALENQTAEITAMQPKADYCDTVLSSEDLTPISVIAKDYGMTARDMNSLLHKEHVQYKQGGTWLLYKEHADKGYTKTKTNKFKGIDGQPHVKIHTYCTQKGRHFIYEILKSKGVKPMTEK